MQLLEPWETQFNIVGDTFTVRLQRITVAGREWFLVHELREFLGLRDLKAQITRTTKGGYADRYTPEKDYINVSGTEFAMLRGLLRREDVVLGCRPMSTRATFTRLLSRSGVQVACLQAGSPIGKPLLGWVKSHRIPVLEPDGPHQITVTGDFSYVATKKPPVAEELQPASIPPITIEKIQESILAGLQTALIRLGHTAEAVEEMLIRMGKPTMRCFCCPSYIGEDAIVPVLGTKGVSGHAINMFLTHIGWQKVSGYNWNPTWVGKSNARYVNGKFTGEWDKEAVLAMWVANPKRAELSLNEKTKNKIECIRRR